MSVRFFLSVNRRYHFTTIYVSETAGRRIDRLSAFVRPARRRWFLQCVRQCLNFISLQRPFRQREPNSRCPNGHPLHSLAIHCPQGWRTRLTDCVFVGMEVDTVGNYPTPIGFTHPQVAHFSGTLLAVGTGQLPTYNTNSLVAGSYLQVAVERA